MTRHTPIGLSNTFPAACWPMISVAVAAILLPMLCAAQVQAQGLGAGGEGMSWRYEEYLQREAEIARQKSLADFKDPVPQSQRADSGTTEFGAFEVIGGPDTQERPIARHNSHEPPNSRGH